MYNELIYQWNLAITKNQVFVKHFYVEIKSQLYDFKKTQNNKRKKSKKKNDKKSNKSVESIQQAQSIQ